jgi:hypothetical protein
MAKDAGGKELRQVDQSVPEFMRVGSGKSFAAKVVNEFKSNHRWLSLWFKYESDTPRVVRVLSALTGVYFSFFLMSITYGFTNEDDGSCELIENPTYCLEEKSAFDSSKSKCYWYVKKSVVNVRTHSLQMTSKNCFG